MQSYQAYTASQAGPDSPYRSGVTPAKYVQHLAKVAPIGRFGGAIRPAGSPLNLATSPYDSPYTASSGQAASPSVGAGTRAAIPSLANNGPATSPSNGAIARPVTPTTTAGPAASPSNGAIARPVTPLTTAGPAASPNIGSMTRLVTPALSAGNNSVPSSPAQSPARSPSPDAIQLISSLANYESLSDDALYDAALNAQQAMVKWQEEYMALKTEITRMRRSPHNRKEKRKANPRKVEDLDEYDSPGQPTPNITQTTGNNPRNTTRPRATNPINKPPFNGRRPRNELHIDMNEPMQPVEGKRIRKPRVIDDIDATVTAPKKSTKRAREPDTNDANAPVIDQPAAKKQDTRARSFTPPDWVRTARTIKPEAKETSAAPQIEPKKRERPAKVAPKPLIKTEPKEETEGKDPVRAAAARLMWAKRQANGTNGRHGGAPKGSTVAKAKGKEEGGEGEEGGK